MQTSGQVMVSMIAYGMPTVSFQPCASSTRSVPCLECICWFFVCRWRVCIKPQETGGYSIQRLLGAEKERTCRWFAHTWSFKEPLGEEGELSDHRPEAFQWSWHGLSMCLSHPLLVICYSHNIITLWSWFVQGVWYFGKMVDGIDCCFSRRAPWWPSHAVSASGVPIWLAEREWEKQRDTKKKKVHRLMVWIHVCLSNDWACEVTCCYFHQCLRNAGCCEFALWAPTLWHQFAKTWDRELFISQCAQLNLDLVYSWEPSLLLGI